MFLKASEKKCQRFSTIVEEENEEEVEKTEDAEEYFDEFSDTQLFKGFDTFFPNMIVKSINSYLGTLQ